MKKLLLLLLLLALLGSLNVNAGMFLNRDLEKCGNVAEDSSISIDTWAKCTTQIIDRYKNYDHSLRFLKGDYHKPFFSDSVINILTPKGFEALNKGELWVDMHYEVFLMFVAPVKTGEDQDGTIYYGDLENKETTYI